MNLYNDLPCHCDDYIEKVIGTQVEQNNAQRTRSVMHQIHLVKICIIHSYLLLLRRKFSMTQPNNCQCKGCNSPTIQCLFNFVTMFQTFLLDLILSAALFLLQHSYAVLKLHLHQTTGLHYKHSYISAISTTNNMPNEASFLSSLPRAYWY